MVDSACWLDGRCILVVEDDALIALTLVSYLEELGATVMWSTDVLTAVGFIDHSTKIDIAIVDLNLDGEMSTAVIDRLIDRKVFTILCTGYDASNIAERFQKLPCSQKPFTRAKINRLIAAGL